MAWKYLPGSLIKLGKNIRTFNAKAGKARGVETDIISQLENNMVLIGVSNNVPANILDNIINSKIEDNTLVKQLKQKNVIKEKVSYISEGKNSDIILGEYCDYNSDNIGPKQKKEFYKGIEMYNDAYYFVRKTVTTRNIGRIYDFKITDCSDIDFKNVFRENTASGNINELKIDSEYFSGTKKFNLYSGILNELIERGEKINISSSAKRILPLGPYKNTNTSYVNAPKMGYRISFDLKTSGVYNPDDENSNREIEIKPSYYYISKDGKNYIPNIDLYYKNSSGKYVNFKTSKYTIYFKPNDGYRWSSNSSVTDELKHMSSNLVGIEVSNKFTLTEKMMAYASDNYFVQSWYGEFKLPNSTIAVKDNNVSKPLTDGYIGVKFDIACVDTVNDIKQPALRYGNNNRSASGVNTSQWDYEGYLGFNNPGKGASDIGIQLEKGTWIVNDNNSSTRTSAATYNDIKGTVVLFDLDNRAANDFD